jgi:hypothetical protein
MKTSSMRYFGAITFAGLFVALTAWVMTTHAAPALNSQVVDAKGNMKVPADYRTRYEFLGTWAIAADQGKGSKEMHTVYASPGSIAAYRSTGKFPDDAVLVKEVAEVMTSAMTTGTVSHAESLKGWFLMVKDEKGRFPDNKLWGDGWGWAWFDAPIPNKTTSTNYKADCVACHTPAKKTDWIYTDGYPPLRR